MNGLSRVPSGGSPFHRGTAVLAGAMLIVVVSLALEPWAETDPVTPVTTGLPVAGERTTGSDGPDGSDAAAARPVIPARTYDPAAFGAPPDDAVWTIRTRSVVVTMPSLGQPDDGSVVSGPVVDLGPAGALDALVVAGPTGERLDAIRLWRFDGDREPERLALDRVAAPWSSGAAWAVGLRAGRPGDDLVGAWQPGLYRLDLLVMPATRVRMVMLVVSGTADAGAAPAGGRETDAPAAFDLPLLEHLPDAATIWTYGRVLTGWARESSPGDCAVAAIWVATDPDDPCWAVPIGRASALGANLPDGRVADDIALAAVDPLPGPMATRTVVDVAGRPGLAAAWAPEGGLADGIYRVTVTARDGTTFDWYAEVGPSSRQTEAINVFVAGGDASD